MFPPSASINVCPVSLIGFKTNNDCTFRGLRTPSATGCYDYHRAVTAAILSDWRWTAIKRQSTTIWLTLHNGNMVKNKPIYELMPAGVFPGDPAAPHTYLQFIQERLRLSASGYAIRSTTIAARRHVHLYEACT